MEKKQSKTKPESNIPYESLPDFPAETNFVKLLREITNTIIETPENEWEKHVTAINSLRSLKKYQPKLFYTILYDMDIQSKLSKYISSIRSSVTIPTLMLIKETFSEYQFEYNEHNEPIELVHIVKHFLPDLISKSLSEKAFIRDGAKSCLETCSKNMLYSETLITLLNECSNEKNIKTVDVACETLMSLIENFEANYLIYYDNWKVVFENLAKMWNLKKEIYIKYPGRIFEQFKKKIGTEEFDKIFEKKCSSEHEKKDILAAVEYSNDKTIKIKEKKEAVDIKELIKQSKMKNENSHINTQAAFQLVTNENKDISNV